MIALLARLASSPLVSRLLIPALSQYLAEFFYRKARESEYAAALKRAKVGKTAEEIRLASKKLSDASRRN